MKILNRYFSHQVWTGFVGFGLVLGGLAWMVQILLLLKLIIRYGVEVGGFLKLSVYTIPLLASIIAPFSLFITVMFIYNKMLESSEIAICGASGLGPWKIARPAIKIGFIVMIAHFALNLWVVPKSQESFNREQWNLRFGLGHMKIREGAFTQMTDKVVIYVEAAKNKDMSGLILRDGRGRDERYITSEVGKLVSLEKGLAIVMGRGGMQFSGKSSKLVGTFDSAQMDLDIGDETQGSGLRARAVPTGELIKSLGQLSKQTKKNAAKLVSEAATRFLTPIMNLLFVLIAMAALLKTNMLRRRASWAAAMAAAAMAAAETAFMSATASVAILSGFYLILGAQVAAVIVLLWILRK
ncbi:MAG: LptF/LptG family permease [Rickettsiales bacterium]|nr:LptF/LptG family permease [Rickettsiales bacterium]